jgi:glycosyltransferase involved in cell wall biosynthesis
MPRPMRIVHLADYGGSYPGSFIPMLRAVNDAALERGWSFEAVFTEVAEGHAWHRELEVDGITVRIAPHTGRRALTAWLEDLLSQRNEPTVLHTHFTTFDIPAVAAARRRDDVATVWHVHTRLQSGPKAAARNAMKFSLVGRQVEAILCVSNDLRDSLHRRLAPAHHLVVFPNAIDLERFDRASPAERSQARAEIGIPDGCPLLVHFGWDWETKGGDLFLETVAQLANDGMEVTGMCVGGGEPAHSAIARLKLGDRVIVTPPRDQVRTIYAAANVFVSSSRAEGMSYAVLEALSTGTPTVVSDIPSHIALAERVQGCIVAARDPQSFATAIRSALSSDRQVDIGKLTDSLDLRAWAQRLMDLYAEIN